jgi:cytochrome c biogenesis protein ResB
MSGRQVLRRLSSSRATIALLCLLSLLLLLNVVIPQASVLGERDFGDLATRSRSNFFILISLGLGRLPTSPVFLTVLGLFFLQLALVLIVRAEPTLRRIRMQRRSRSGLEAWTRTHESLSSPLPMSWDLRRATRTLRGYGYQVKRIDDRLLWGVKHRTAHLGFLLFHLSFFLLFVGGMLIYYTRTVGTAVLTEGQSFSEFREILRRAPMGEGPELSFTVDSVDPRFERGEPTYLGAVFLFDQGGSLVERRASINHPARWGATSILVREAGLAPVLWLQDHRGFTLDRVAVTAATRGDEPNRVPLNQGQYEAVLQPLAPGRAFPDRDALSTEPLRLQILQKKRDEDDEDFELLFDGTMTPGEAIPLGDRRLVLEEIRYWVGIQVVSERGGAFLVAGFVVAVAGLIWRLLLYRREVVLSWDEEAFRLVGRSESYPWRFRRELESLYARLQECGSSCQRKEPLRLAGRTVC